ncbi:hyaluronan and proteoglycan link protein 3 isoform X1 [Balaenoptera acutorostrata]|uniref:Hyaluronan and proteoglycan link protein 3 isoform X1 n=1 Tax=Balaenoptera acutorostrata TaxID=9767 RepID=A0ABM3TAQ7_BALAC|nr:hyaluronan and proteoglycan link protein 3 isoform X1 [Balaenoptera acutorostrata]
MAVLTDVRILRCDSLNSWILPSQRGQQLCGLGGFQPSLETAQVYSTSSLWAQPEGGKGACVPLRGWPGGSAGICSPPLPFWPFKIPKSACFLGPGQPAAWSARAVEELPGDGIFNGVKLVVETPEEILFSYRGANVTLPCRYHYEPALVSPRPVRIKWWKLSENGAPEQDVLVAIGLRHRAFGDYRGRVHLWQEREREVSLEIRDLRLEDYGRYRCEVIDGLEDESGLVELELRGVVFPYQHPQGRYQFNFHEAQWACEEQDAVVASFEQLFRAWEEGLDWCNAGWLQDASVQYPITQARHPCGGLGLAPGVRSYGPRHRRLHRYDVFCFAAALRGEVYYLEHPEKLTLAEAKEACQEDDAQIAKVGQLFAAWKFHGLDRCDAGWLADGSARYPVAHARHNCGSLEPGVRSFGFPDPHSRNPVLLKVWPAPPASPGNVFEMQISGPHP